MYKLLLFIIISCSAATLAGCSIDDIDAPEEKDLEFNYALHFSESEAQNWKAGFADYPAGEEEFYKLEWGFATVPPEAGEEKPSIRISGNNHSDDLFMFLYRKLDGLEPNTTYELRFKVELASNAPRNSVGVGGSPGSSVYLKAGALTTEPELIQDNTGEKPYLLTKFDKGNQSQGGKDMLVLGNIGTELEEFRYTFIERTHSTPLAVTTNEAGELWIMVGTDSGFEATTTLYYTAVKVQTIKKK